MYLKSVGPTVAALVNLDGISLVSVVVLVTEELPESVDPAKKEEYLSEAEFAQVLGLQKEEFSSLPAWKQVNLKKSAGLF